MRRSWFNIFSSINQIAQKPGTRAIVDQAIISGLNFLTFLMLARWMEVDAFGQYILAFSAVVFLQSIQHALLTRAHNVMGAIALGKNSAAGSYAIKIGGMNEDEANSLGSTEYARLTRVTFQLVAGFGVLVTLVFALAGVVFGSLGLDSWTEACFAIAIVSAPWLVQDAVRRILYTSDRIGAAIWNNTVCYGSQVLFFIALYFSGIAITITTVFVALSVSSLLASLVGLNQLKPVLSGFFKRDPSFGELTNRIWTFGKWLVSGECIGWVGQNGSTWIIGALLGAPLVAGYRAATYVTNLLNPLDLSVSNFIPVKAAKIASEHGQAAMLKWLKEQALMYCTLYAALVLGISIGSMYLLDLFFDSRYVTELFALVLAISAVGRFFGFVANFARLGLIASEKTRPIMVSQILSLIVFGTVSIGLIAWMGITGAPLARIVLHSIVGSYLGFTLLKKDLAPLVHQTDRVNA